MPQLSAIRKLFKTDSENMDCNIFCFNKTVISSPSKGKCYCVVVIAIAFNSAKRLRNAA